MNQQELKKQIDAASATIADEMPKATPDDKKFAGFALMGIALVGELLLDIKRIADAVEANAFIEEPRP